MKKMLFAAVAALALVSCASDVVTDVQRDEITFRTSTNNTVRATVVESANFNEFQVWAYTDAGKMIFEDTKVSKGTSAWSYGDKKYWPNSGTVNFYGLYPTSVVTGTVNANTAKFEYTSTVTDGAVQASATPDVVYSTAIGYSKQNVAVPMNFRHVMSQIEFRVANTSKDLEMSITGDITIYDLNTSGVYNLPRTKSTSEEFAVAASHGSWDFTGKSTANYVFNVEAGLGAGPGDNIEWDLLGKGQNALVVPQTKETIIHIPYIIEQNDIVIYEGVKELPLRVEWNEGCKYAYTISITNAISDVVPIELTATVDVIKGDSETVRP